MDYSQQNFASWSAHLIGPTSKVIDAPVGSKIVSIDFLQSGTASNTWVECGGMQIARNFARDAQVDMAFVATTTCQAVKTGNDESFVTIVYSSAPAISTQNTEVYMPEYTLMLLPMFAFLFFYLVAQVIKYISYGSK